MEWTEVIRALADLLTAIAAIIAAVGAWRAHKESKETRKTVQAMQAQQQTQTIQQHQYYGPVYQGRAEGEGQEPTRPIEFNRGEFPPVMEADPHTGEQGGASQ